MFEVFTFEVFFSHFGRFQDFQGPLATLTMDIVLVFLIIKFSKKIERKFQKKFPFFFRKDRKVFFSF